VTPGSTAGSALCQFLLFTSIKNREPGEALGLQRPGDSEITIFTDRKRESW